MAQEPKTTDEVKIPFPEMLKSVPGIFGIHIGEKPEFTVVRNEGVLEVRQYPALTLAQVTLSGDFASYRERAFRKLAGYIFGKNKTRETVELKSAELSEDAERAATSETMSMTTPVLQQETSRGWVMSFVLPEKYTAETAPQPLDESVRIVSQPARTVAVLSYSGNNTAAKLEEKLTELRGLLAGSTNLSLVGDPYCAQYDAPFAIPFLKTNEVQAEVRVLH